MPNRIIVSTKGTSMKKTALVLVMATLLVFAFAASAMANTDQTVVTWTSGGANAATDATPEGPTTYQVTGMTCGHCAGNVTEAVSALPQVDDVQVDLIAGGVSIVTVTGSVPLETVHRAIEETGYTVLS